MRRLFSALAGGAAALCLGATANPEVEYTVTPMVQDGALRSLAVQMRLRGDADGATRLALSDWGQEPNPWSKIAGFEAPGAEVVQATPKVRVLRHRPGAPLLVRYRVVSAHEALPPPERIATLHRPAILPAFFGVYGETVFATPEDRDEAPVRFRWGPRPKGWRLASDLDHPGGRNLSRTANSFMMGAPDLRVVEREAMGGPVRVALHGKFEFEDAAFADAIARIAEAQRRFWGDRNAAFFVPMIALPPPESGYSSIGTGRGDASALWATGNIKLDGLTRLLAHEHMHSWIDDEVGRRLEDEEGLEYWFSEGFTDFYALRTLLGAGLFTPEDHAREMNEALLRLASSPARTAPNARIKAAFWSDDDVRQLPYDRGHFFAALLDHRLREASGGRVDLDDVLRAQRAHARARPSTDRTSSGRLLPVFTKQAAGLDIQPLIERHIRDGEPIELPADLYGDCARVETAIRPDFHRGFDIDATGKNNKVITGVRADGPAYAAGMRDGMTLVRREPSPVNDPAVEIAYHVLDNGAERVIRYLPAGRERFRVQRVVLAEGMTPERRAACARRMSGG